MDWSVKESLEQDFMEQSTGVPSFSLTLYLISGRVFLPEVDQQALVSLDEPGNFKGMVIEAW